VTFSLKSAASPCLCLQEYIPDHQRAASSSAIVSCFSLYQRTFKCDGFNNILNLADNGLNIWTLWDSIDCYYGWPCATCYLMMFWLGGTHKNPRLPLLARTIGYSSNQCPSERVCYTARRTVNVKPSSLAPSTVDKVVFIHENAHLVRPSRLWVAC